MNNILLWAGQIFLAIAFLYSGICKSIFSEKDLIAKGQTGVVGLSAALIRFIGICEIMGSIGIILPWWIRVLPVFTPLSALCFAVLMILAAPIHYRLKENKNIAVNITLLIISLLVAFGRWSELCNM